MEKIKIANQAFPGPKPVVIVGVYTEERFLSDGKPDTEKMNPFVLSMPDNHYWCLDEPIGRAWQSGREFKPRPQ